MQHRGSLAEWESLAFAAHVWHLSPKALDANELVRRFLSWLTPEEQTRRESLRTESLRHVDLASKVLCRLVLSSYAGIDPRTWMLTRNAHGKPEMAGPSQWASLRFNLTHTDGLIALIVTRAGEVGLDAEETSRAVDVAAVARHSLSSVELACLEGLPPDRRAARFFEYWVLKEAYLKGLGTGLTETPEDLIVHLNDEGSPRPIGDWQLALHRPTPHHVAATAIQRANGASPIPIVWRSAEELYKLASPS